jgi:hypothetical protein
MDLMVPPLIMARPVRKTEKKVRTAAMIMAFLSLEISWDLQEPQVSKYLKILCQQVKKDNPNDAE